MKTSQEVLDRLDLGGAGTQPFHLAVGPYRVTVHAPAPLRDALTGYFADVLSDQAGGIMVHLLPGQEIRPEPAWVDWQREPGKAGRKDAILDLADGRLIRKVRSGVTFLQAPGAALAFGPLAAHESTVINFINTQILCAGLRDGAQLCHAAALRLGARMLAVSGLSGRGKSTSILRLMDLPGTQFTSNDRLLVFPGDPPRALGIPKHPRINPGTILGNPRLAPMLSPARRAELAKLPPADLWQLEDKHDLIVPDIYGPDRVRLDGDLTDFWVLNWDRTATAPTCLTEVNLAERTDLLTAIMKSPGPFYQYPDGYFEPNGAQPDPAGYLAALRGVRIAEITGRVDFDALADLGRALLDG